MGRDGVGWDGIMRKILKKVKIDSVYIYFLSMAEMEEERLKKKIEELEKKIADLEEKKSFVKQDLDFLLNIVKKILLKPYMTKKEIIYNLESVHHHCWIYPI